MRDATDRIVERKVNGNTVARYVHAGPGDSPSSAYYGLLLLGRERYLSLVGGVPFSKAGPDGDIWSYPNVHGDVVAVADAGGTKVGATHRYDPYGEALSAGPANSTGAENLDYGSLGSHQRPLEQDVGLPTIEMGARPYWWWGTDLAVVTPAEVDHAASIINGQRRRSLGYRSPAMLYADLAVQ